MAASETLEFSDLVFVNWAKEEYASLSDSILTNADGLNTEDIQSKSSQIDAPLESNQDSVFHDLSIHLYLFDRYKARYKDNYSPDLPHLFVEPKISNSFLISLISLTALLGIFSLLISPWSMMENKSTIPEIAASFQTLDRIQFHQFVPATVSKSYVSHAYKERPDHSAKSPVEISNQKLSSKNYKKSVLINRLLLFVKRIIVAAKIYFKKRIYQLRKDVRVFLKGKIK